MISYDFDGCMFNLCSIVHKDALIQKPWSLVTNMTELAKFDKVTCNHDKALVKHAKCEGKDT